MNNYAFSDAVVLSASKESQSEAGDQFFAVIGGLKDAIERLRSTQAHLYAAHGALLRLNSPDIPVNDNPTSQTDSRCTGSRQPSPRVDR